MTRFGGKLTGMLNEASLLTYLFLGIDMKKIVYSCIFICSILVILTGCILKNSERGEMVVDKVELNEKQIEILVKSGCEEDRVREGVLTRANKKMLEDYEAVLEYLEEKYSGVGFEFYDCIPKGMTQSYTTFYMKAENVEEIVEIEVEEVEEKKEIKDNFYGIHIRDAYTEKIYEKLLEINEKCERTEIAISGLYGREYNSDLTIEQVLENRMYLKAIGTIYLEKIESKLLEERAEKIKKYMKECGFTGSFRLMIVGDEKEEYIDFHIFKDK